MCKNYKIKKFIDLTDDEKIKVLQWRNHSETVKFMNTKEISLEEHLRFIDSLQEDQDKQYFLVDDIGVIYLVGNEIGLYKNPKKQGVGKILLSKIIQIGMKKNNKLILEVFKTNTKAIALYKKYGFKTIKEDKEKIYMELNKISFNKIKEYYDKSVWY